MNDQENYGGTCFNSSGTNKITCPAQPSYSPYPSSSPTSGGSCPSGSHIVYVNNAGGYCMSDSDSTKCGPLSSTSVGGFGSCSSYQSTATYSPAPGTSYTPYPTTSYTPYPTTSYTPYPTTSYTPYPTTSYTPPPTSTYSPPPSNTACPSGQYWNGSACVIGVLDQHTAYMVAHCQQLGRTWNGSLCQANGSFAKIYKGFLANTLRALGF